MQNAHVHGPAKYCQLGVPAWDTLLDGLLNGVDLSSTPAVVLIDLNMIVGDALSAFFKHRRLHTGTYLHYFGLSESQVETTWIEKSVCEELVEMVLVGSYTLPGEKFEDKLDEDGLDVVPLPPKLNCLVFSESKEFLMIPQDILKKWQMHPKFGKEFTMFMDGFLEETTHKLMEEITDPITPDGKRKNPLADLNLATPNPDGKKKKLSHAKVVEPSSITDVLIKEVRIGTGKEQPMLQLRANHNIYILNNSLQEWSSNMGCIAGFGRGGFKLLKADGSDFPAGAIEFACKSSSDKVVFNNKK